MGFRREVWDLEAFGLAVFAAVAAYLVDRDALLAAIAAIGVMAVRGMAGVMLHGTHPPPTQRFPGLTESETLVAWYVFRGRGNPAIARRTGWPLSRVARYEARIKQTWKVATREEVVAHVSQILSEPSPHKPESTRPREWMAEFATGLAIIGVGLAILAVPPETVILGGIRDWLGLSLSAAGVVFLLVSTLTYLLENRHRH